MGNCNCPSDIVQSNGGFLCNEGQSCTITENMWSLGPNIQRWDLDVFAYTYGCDDDYTYKLAFKQGVEFECTDTYFGEDPKPESAKVCCYQPLSYRMGQDALPILDPNPYEFEVDVRLFYFGLILISLFLVLNIYWIIKMVKECNRTQRKSKQQLYVM